MPWFFAAPMEKNHIAGQRGKGLIQELGCQPHHLGLPVDREPGALEPGVFIHAMRDVYTETGVVRVSPEVHALLPPAQLRALAALPEAEARERLDALQAVHSMRALTVTLDGTPVYTETWSDGALIGVVRRFHDWTPASDGGDDGSHVIRATVANWANVVTVRIGMLMRTVDQYGQEEDIGNFDNADFDNARLDVAGTVVCMTTDTNATCDQFYENDRRRRRVFETTLAMRNLQ